MSRILPILWTAREGGKVIQFTSGGSPFVWRFPNHEVISPPVITSAPVIGGTGELGSAVILVEPVEYTSDTEATVRYELYSDGVLINSGGIEEFTFSTPIGSVIKIRAIVVNGGGEVISSFSNTISVIEDDGVEPFHANFPDATWSVVEDDRTPEVQVEFVPEEGFDSLYDPVNFSYHFVCTISTNPPTDPSNSTQITSATIPTPRIGGARTVGTTIYSRIYAKRLSDNVIQIVSNIKSQVLVGSGGEEVELASIIIQPNPGKAEALSKGYTKYDLVGSHIQNAYHARIVLCNSLNAYLGDSASVTWTIGQIKFWLSGNRAAQMEGGYFGNWEMLMCATALIALRTPAVVSGLTATEIEALELVIETGLYTGAALMADTNTLSPERNMRGRTASYKSVNPNIGSSSVALVHLALIHFGLTECDNKLKSFDKEVWRQTLLNNGLLDAAALTYNGYTGSTSGTVSTPPTNAQMKSWFAVDPFKIRGYVISTGAGAQNSIINMMKHQFGTDSKGNEDTVGNSTEPTIILPGVYWNLGKDWNNNSPDGNLGVPHRNAGNRRGRFEFLTEGNYDTVAADFPFYGEVGCIKEMNAVDEGGQRSSASYSMNTSHIWMAHMIPLMVIQPSWFDWRSSEVKSIMERARKGMVQLRVCSSEPTIGGIFLGRYWNLAKPSLTNSSNSETWGLNQGSLFAFNASFGLVFDVIFKWLRDSGIIDPLTGDLAQWEDPVNFIY